MFAPAGTLYDLTVTLRRGQAGDIAHHLALLSMLAASAVLLLAEVRAGRGTRSTGRARPSAEVAAQL